jgi:hypothetical protein
VFPAHKSSVGDLINKNQSFSGNKLFLPWIESLFQGQLVFFPLLFGRGIITFMEMLKESCDGVKQGMPSYFKREQTF